MLGIVVVTHHAAILQMVVDIAIKLYVIIILPTGLHIIVSVLIESSEGVIVIDLVVETEASFKERITLGGMLTVGDGP